MRRTPPSAASRPSLPPSLPLLRSLNLSPALSSRVPVHTVWPRSNGAPRRERGLWTSDTCPPQARGHGASPQFERRVTDAGLLGGRVSPMTRDDLAAWQPLAMTRNLKREGIDSRALQRQVASKQLVRIRRGVCVDTATWNAADVRGHHVLRMRAVEATRNTPVVFSHLSAAALWGLPVLGQWPAQVHLSSAGRPGLHSKNGVICHREDVPDDQVTQLDGMFVTSLERTLLDVARTTSFASSVAMLDHGTQQRIQLPSGANVPGIDKHALLESVAALGPVAGIRRARLAVDFCDNRSGSVGESLSRVDIHLCGFPPPELQVAFPRGDGGKDIVDFRWEQRQESRTLRLLGEFDGKVKYTRDEYTHGLPIEEVMWQEKLREDRLRASSGHHMVRWTWDMALRREPLRQLLLNAGLRPVTGGHR